MSISNIVKDRDTILLEGLYESIRDMDHKWCAIVLDDKSRSRLFNIFKSDIPEGWNVSCNHMTIDAFKPLEREEDLGKVIRLMATRYISSDGYMAVEVEGYPVQGGSFAPHVSIADRVRVDMDEKFPPINNRVRLEEPIELVGTIENVDKDRVF